MAPRRAMRRASAKARMRWQPRLRLWVDAMRDSHAGTPAGTPAEWVMLVTHIQTANPKMGAPIPYTAGRGLFSSSRERARDSPAVPPRKVTSTAYAPTRSTRLLGSARQGEGRQARVLRAQAMRPSRLEFRSAPLDERNPTKAAGCTRCECNLELCDVRVREPR